MRPTLRIAPDATWHPEGPYRTGFPELPEPLATSLARWHERAPTERDREALNTEGWRIARALKAHVGAAYRVAHAALLPSGHLSADRDVPSEAELPGGWALVAEDNVSLVRELVRELKPGHSLHGVGVLAVARRHSQDDFLFALEHLAYPFAVVHLTWAGDRERPPWPGTTYLPDYDAFVRTFADDEDDDDVTA